MNIPSGANVTDGRTIKLAARLLIAPALVALALAAASGAAAAQADVRLAGVDCDSAPEVIEVKNFGSEDQSLSGWKLLSDPNESFDLTTVGTVPAGGSVFIEAGPGAQAAFTWSQSQVLRDNDPGDYVRLVDNAGQTKSQVACAQATPTLAPTAAPTPTATPVAPGAVPNGGGPPGTTGAVLSSLTLIYAGGGIVGVSAGLSLAWLAVNLGIERRRRRAAPEAVADAAAVDVAEPATAPMAAESRTRPTPRSRPAGRGAAAQPLLLALLVALAAAVLVALLVQSDETTRRR